METGAKTSAGATRGDAATHDVAIVGGGLVGASLAIALDRLGVDVAMVEVAPGGTLPAVFDEPVHPPSPLPPAASLRLMIRAWPSC